MPLIRKAKRRQFNEKSVFGRFFLAYIKNYYYLCSRKGENEENYYKQIC